MNCFSVNCIISVGGLVVYYTNILFIEMPCMTSWGKMYCRFEMPLVVLQYQCTEFDAFKFIVEDNVQICC